MKDLFNLLEARDKADNSRNMVIGSFSLTAIAFAMTAISMHSTIYNDRDTDYLALDHNAAGRCIGDQFSISHWGTKLDEALAEKNVVFDTERSGDWIRDCMEYHQDTVVESAEENVNKTMISLFAFLASGLGFLWSLESSKKRDEEFIQLLNEYIREHPEYSGATEDDFDGVTIDGKATVFDPNAKRVQKKGWGIPFFKTPTLDDF